MAKAVTPPPPARAKAKGKTKPKPKSKPKKSTSSPQKSKGRQTTPLPREAPKRRAWYVIRVVAQKEESVRDDIERRVKREGLSNLYDRCVIPVETHLEVKLTPSGKRKTISVTKKLYLGYLFVRLHYCPEMFYVIRSVHDALGFVGPSTHGPLHPPTSLKRDEIERILGNTPGEIMSLKKTPSVPPGIVPGASIRILDGTFQGIEGTIDSIQEEKGKVRVTINVLGRPVRVELEYFQIRLT